MHYLGFRSSRVYCEMAWLLWLLLGLALGRTVRVDPRSEAALNPGDVVEPFWLQTLSGNFSYYLNGTQEAVIFLTYTAQSGFDQAMWYNELYVKNLFWRSPKDTQYVFLCLDEDAESTAVALHQIFEETMLALKLSPTEQSK